jgi:hypothetical protein
MKTRKLRKITKRSGGGGTGSKASVAPASTNVMPSNMPMSPLGSLSDMEAEAIALKAAALAAITAAKADPLNKTARKVAYDAIQETVKKYTILGNVCDNKLKKLDVHVGPKLANLKSDLNRNTKTLTAAKTNHNKPTLRNKMTLSQIQRHKDEIVFYNNLLKPFQDLRNTAKAQASAASKQAEKYSN